MGLSIVKMDKNGGAVDSATDTLEDAASEEERLRAEAGQEAEEDDEPE